MIPAITGLGISSAIGCDRHSFWDNLNKGGTQFDFMQRPGRQQHTHFIGAEIQNFVLDKTLRKGIPRTTSLTAQLALATVKQAWDEANLESADPERIGLIIGGSNIQQRELFSQYERYSSKLEYLRPSYAVGFMDTDCVGVCTQQLGIKGPSFTVGGASASGQLAIIKSLEAVESGVIDTCIAVGALSDISFLECQAYRSLGAMGSDRFKEEPSLAYRPFDKHRDGFIYGEACAAVVIQNPERATASSLVNVPGWAMYMDSQQGPEPSFDGERITIQNALTRSGLSSRDIDYVNPHGSGSTLGDEIELEVIRSLHLDQAYINATKSLTGHGLTAAGAVEFVASILQIEHQKLHPSANLENPICNDLNWVPHDGKIAKLNKVLNISLGFGGINTAVCLSSNT